MIGMRVGSIAAALLALVMISASPAVASPQSGAAETSRQGPSSAELAEVRTIVAEYRRLWNEFDAETRGMARQYGAITPDELERMFRDWESGRTTSMPNLPGNLPGGLSDTFKKLPGNASARPGPAKPGEELPDFANGAAKETLDTLKDAKVSLDDIRDKHAETASCSPEALAAKQALQTKLDAYRKALADMEAARADVAPQPPTGMVGTIGTALQRNSAYIGGGLAATKATADAAMELFGAAANLLPESPLQRGMERVGAAYNVASGLVAQGTADTVGGAVSGATSVMSGGLRLAGSQAGVDPGGATQAALYAAAFDLAGKTIDTNALRSETSREGATGRDVETVGNVVQTFGTGLTALGELPHAEAAVKRTGGVFSAAGTVASTSAKYDRELGKAFDQILAGEDERRGLDALTNSTLRQIDAKRIEFMQKIAALEAEIGRLSCVK